MHFTTPVLLLSAVASVAVAAPHKTEHKPAYNKDQYKKDCDQDWEQKWKDDAWKKDEKIFYFDSEYYVKATPEQVVNNVSVSTPGQPGAKGIFKYGINVAENTICYNITLSGVTGNYSSPAKTATHIHEGAKGRAGPPRISLPNPKGPDERRVSYGCLTGPFTTGINVTGTMNDTGMGFHVKQIVANPSGFFTDSHTATFLAGAVRGQLA